MIPSQVQEICHSSSLTWKKGGMYKVFVENKEPKDHDVGKSIEDNLGLV